MLKASSTNTDNAPAFDLVYILKSVAISYAISVILLLPAALIATYQCLSDRGISILVNLVTALGVTSCGFMSGRHSSRGGIFSGALSGIIYAAILYLIGNLAAQNLHFGMNAVTAAVIGIVCGAAGGIVGINTRSKKRR